MGFPSWLGKCQRSAASDRSDASPHQRCSWNLGALSLNASTLGRIEP
jgi:hypothetical protein